MQAGVMEGLIRSIGSTLCVPYPTLRDMVDHLLQKREQLGPLHKLILAQDPKEKELIQQAEQLLRQCQSTSVACKAYDVILAQLRTEGSQQGHSTEIKRLEQGIQEQQLQQDAQAKYFKALIAKCNQHQEETGARLAAAAAFQQDWEELVAAKYQYLALSKIELLRKRKEARLALMPYESEDPSGWRYVVVLGSPTARKASFIKYQLHTLGYTELANQVLVPACKPGHTDALVPYFLWQQKVLLVDSPDVKSGDKHLMGHAVAADVLIIFLPLETRSQLSLGEAALIGWRLRHVMRVFFVMGHPDNILEIGKYPLTGASLPATGKEHIKEDTLQPVQLAVCRRTQAQICHITDAMHTLQPATQLDSDTSQFLQQAINKSEEAWAHNLLNKQWFSILLHVSTGDSHTSGATPRGSELAKLECAMYGMEASQVRENAVKGSLFSKLQGLGRFLHNTCAGVSRQPTWHDARTLKSLVRLLGSSHGAVQEEAAEALRKLASVDSKTRAAIASAGAVPALVQLLSSSNSKSSNGKVQAHAAAVLANLLSDPGKLQAAVAAAGAVNPLVQLLSSSHVQGQEMAAVALTRLCTKDKNNNNKVAIAVAGGVRPLVQLLSSSCTKVQLQAAAAVLRMAEDRAIRAAIAAAGAIRPLVQLLGSSQHVQVQAAGALANMALGGGELSAAVAAAGAIPPLVQLLSSSSTAAQALAAMALKRLAARSAKNKLAIVAAGAIPRLVQLLSSWSDARVQEQAASALVNLAADRAHQAPIAAAGAIPALVQLLNSSNAQLQTVAADALANLALDSGIRPAVANAAWRRLGMLMLCGPSLKASEHAERAMHVLALPLAVEL